MAAYSERQRLAGSHARILRRRKSITLDTLAGQMGLSKSHLSRFERGEKALSVMSLLRLAEALETSVGKLFGEEVDDADVHCMRFSDVLFERPARSAAEYRHALLSGAGDHTTFLIELEHGKHHEGRSHHAGLELLYLRSGRVRVTLADKVIDLDAGDYLEFSGSTPHLIEALTERAMFLMVVI